MALPGERQDPSRFLADPRGPLIAESRATDPSGDARTQGDAPSYVEILRAAIEGYREVALLRVRLGGALPDKMPDQKTFMRVGFRLQGEDRDIAIGASADQRGWKADLNAGDEFPGSLYIRGRTLIISLRWEDIGGRGGFLWQSTTTWSRASTEEADYGFDSAPDEQLQRYEE